MTVTSVSCHANSIQRIVCRILGASAERDKTGDLMIRRVAIDAAKGGRRSCGAGELMWQWKNAARQEPLPPENAGRMEWSDKARRLPVARQSVLFSL